MIASIVHTPATGQKTISIAIYVSKSYCVNTNLSGQMK